VLLKFWLLLLGGLVVFLAWLILFSRCAKIWGPNTNYENGFSMPPVFEIDDSHNSPADSGLLYVDVWFALALMAAVDAFAVVINFNRSLIHQFHYFISLRLTMLAFIISAAVHLLHDKHNSQAQHPVIVFLLCYTFYIVSNIVFDKLHRLLPVRGIGASRGSFESFCEKMCQFDLPWGRALLFATVNGVVGLILTTLVPGKWAMLNPVVHITWEVTFLGLMATKQTPRYIWFATPVVQASTCVDWGLRQVLVAPKLVMSPWVFLALMLVGRLMLDLHLYTMFRNRPDFHWARNEVLFSTKSLLAFFGGILLLEHLGLPVVTFIKPIAVVILHIFGVLVFLLPASYAIAFGKIKTIRY
jgi:hypothetical protein